MSIYIEGNRSAAWMVDLKYPLVKRRGEQRTEADLPAVEIVGHAIDV